MKYRSNVRVPRPSPQIETAKIRRTIFLKEYSQIKLEDADEYIKISHPDFDYSPNLWDKKDLQAIIAFEPIEIDSSTIITLLKAKISVVLFDGAGKLLGRIEPVYEVQPLLRSGQFQISNEQRIAIMQAACWGKMRRCRRFLMRSYRNQEKLTAACQQLKNLANLVYQQSSIVALQELIGQAMLVFYGALPDCLNDDWQLELRYDGSPMCRMMNFVTQLLEESIKTAVYSVGLDPGVGYWHNSNKQQLGLIADLRSEFSLLAEAAVVRACNWGKIVPQDFSDCWESDTLPKSVVCALTQSYQKKMCETFTYPYTKLNCSYQELFYLQAKQLAWYLSGEIEEYYSPDIK